jgi:hypothetical protein
MVVTIRDGARLLAHRRPQRRQERQLQRLTS